MVSIKRPNPDTQTQLVDRDPNHPIPQELVDLTYEALTAFYESPHTRSRSFWAHRDVEGTWSFSLLGMMCALNGLELLTIPKNEHNAACREFLYGLGFTNRDILALSEVNDYTYDLEVLQIRFDRYAETGKRMPLPHDDLYEIDLRSR